MTPNMLELLKRIGKADADPYQRERGYAGPAAGRTLVALADAGYIKRGEAPFGRYVISEAGREAIRAHVSGVAVDRHQTFCEKTPAPSGVPIEGKRNG